MSESQDSAAHPARPGRIVVEALGGAVVLAVLWLILALINPTTTYHLSPVLVAVAPSVIVRLRSARALSWRWMLTTVASGIVVAGVATVILVLVDALRGPVLAADFTASPGNAFEETMVAIAIGAILGGLVAVIGRRGAPSAP